MDNEKDFLPFPEDLEMDGSQKYYTGGMVSPAIFGLPDSYNGINKRNQLAWNKKGVSLAYMLIPTLKSAIDVIATNLASVPMVLKDAKGNIVFRSDTSGASDNKFLGAIEQSYKYYGLPLMQLWATSLLLYGENVTEKVPSVYGGQYLGLKWLNPLAIQIDLAVTENKTNVLRDTNTRFEEQRIFYYTGRFSSITYTDDEVLYSRAFNPIDDVRGYSDALSALSKANITIEFENFTLAFYANSGHPGLIISPKDRMVGEKQVQEWQRSWNEKFRGSYNQFKTHISGFPFDVHSFDVLDISKPLDVSKDAEIKILRALKVPPEMIGDTSENSYQFSKESKNAFMQTVVRPLSLSIANCINHSGIISEFEADNTLKFGFDFSEYENVAKADLDKQDVLERRVKSGGISVGAYQRALGATVVDGSDDTFLIPQGFVVVKKEALAQPDLIPQPDDSTGPDSNSMNQSERVTQSSTGDQESVEFFGSKNFVDTNKTEQIKPFKRFLSESGHIVHNENENPNFAMIPLKYKMINFNTPFNVIDSIKSVDVGDEISQELQNKRTELMDKTKQQAPDDFRKLYSHLNVQDENIVYKSLGGAVTFEWVNKIVNQMNEADKLEVMKSMSMEEIFSLAKENDLTIEQTMKMFEEFSENYENLF